MNNILKTIIDGSYHNTKETVELYLPNQYQSPNDLIMRIIYLLNKNKLKYVVDSEISVYMDRNACYYGLYYTYGDGFYWGDYIIKVDMKKSRDESFFYTFSSHIPNRYEKKDYTAKLDLCEQTPNLITTFNAFIDKIIQNIIKIKQEYAEDDLDDSQPEGVVSLDWHNLYITEKKEELDKYSDFLQQLKISKEELV